MAIFADTDVERAVGAEVQGADVVEEAGAEGLKLLHDDLAAGNGDVAGGGEATDAVAANDAGVVVLLHRVADVDKAPIGVGGELRVEGDAEQATLAARVH